MTNLILPSRRRFLTMASALVAAPAIVRADSLMRVRSWAEPIGPLPGFLRPTFPTFEEFSASLERAIRDYLLGEPGRILAPSDRSVASAASSGAGEFSA